ncbi:MAG: right-handed parallel beta-helix repeat-containing protein [Candidatus Thermoplasmatota archaeon]|nr:right-handed parallel beta-helix repeat-containing protein [Candidatus Thermoplasmatota archaeon]
MNETQNASTELVKKKKHQSTLISIFLLLTSIIILICSSSILATSEHNTVNPRIISVSPLHDIQEIINNAEEYSTIVFHPGTYNESFIISKPLTLQGFSPENTIILLRTKPNNPGIIISSPFVTFSNFTVTNTAKGLYTTAMRINSPHVLIKNSHFKDTPIGIAVWNDNTSILNSRFTNCSDEGILLVSTSLSMSHNNLIDGCFFFNNTDGIELQESSNNIIINCTFIGNSHAGIDAIRSNNNNNHIINCTFLDNSAFDIYFASSDNNIIKDSTIKNNGEETIFFTSSSSNNYIIHQSSFSSTERFNSNEESSSFFLFSMIEKLNSFLARHLQPFFTILQEFRMLIQKI